MSLFHWKLRVRAAFRHFIIGGSVLALVSLSVAWIWFPYPYFWVSGGLSLFGLIVLIDLILGPLLTFVVFNKIKNRSELYFDLTMIVAVQLAALLYGIWILSLARPVYLVHEVDRFQVVNAADVRNQKSKTLADGINLPGWRGIQLLGVSEATTQEEMFRSIDLAMSGLDLGLRAERWIPLNDAHLDELKRRGYSLDEFLSHHPSLKNDVEQQLSKITTSYDQVRVYPLIGRIDTWSLMFDLKQRIVVGYLPVEGF